MQQLSLINKKVALLLLVFSMATIFAFITLEDLLLGNQTHQMSMRNAITKIEEREHFFNDFLDASATTLRALQDSPIFKRFMEYPDNPDYQRELQQLFRIVALTNPQIMRLRYLNAEGMERMRIERMQEANTPFFVAKERLQDRASQDYFISSKKRPLEKVWFSKLELNKDHGKLEVPYRPTLRAVLPLKEQEAFGGVLVINYDMDTFLNRFMSLPLYDGILSDGLGNVLMHYESNKNWGVFRNAPASLKDDFSKNAKSMISDHLVMGDNTVAQHLDVPIENGLILILQLKQQYVSDTNSSKNTLYVMVIIIVMVLAGIISMLLSSTIGKLYREINKKLEQNNRALERSNLKFFTLFQESLDPIVLIDVKTRKFVEFNQKALEVYGYTQEEFSRLSIMDLEVHNNTVNTLEDQSVAIQKGWGRFITKHRTKSGELRDIKVNLVSVMFDEEHYFFVSLHDITHEKQQQRLIENQKEELETIFNVSKDGIAILDLESRFLDCNGAYLEMIGYTREELLRKTCIGLTVEDDYERTFKAFDVIKKEGFIKSFNKTCIAKNGKELFVSMSAALMPDKKRIVITTKDLSEMKRYEEQLETIAHYDALTGLPNRILKADRLQQAMIHVQRYGGSLAVGYLDLDGFKEVNDTYGHDMGDKVLIELSQRMKRILREGDTLSRLGGDEFVIIIGALEEHESAIMIFKRLLQAASDPIEIENKKLSVSASIGVIFYSQESESLDGDQLIRMADQAMYTAKQTGKNRYHVFSAQD